MLFQRLRSDPALVDFLPDFDLWPRYRRITCDLLGSAYGCRAIYSALLFCLYASIAYCVTPRDLYDMVVFDKNLAADKYRNIMMPFKGRQQ